MPKLSAGRRSSAAPSSSLAVTADLIARAIIAAAGVYGDSPVRVLEPGKGSHRRALVPAVVGICAATGQPSATIRAILGVRADTYSKAKRWDRGQFRDAALAAERAASYAAWRPEARESVVGGQADDRLAPAPEAKPAPRLAPKHRPAPVILPRPAKPPSQLEAEVEERGKGQGLTDEDRTHLTSILKAHGAGFPALVSA